MGASGSIKTVWIKAVVSDRVDLRILAEMMLMYHWCVINNASHLSLIIDFKLGVPTYSVLSKYLSSKLAFADTFNRFFLSFFHML